MSLRYAYNTNGCAHHRLPDALRLIAAAGYDGVALTLDWQHLDPLAQDWRAKTEGVRGWLEELGLDCVIETGARYLLDPTEKHEPTLINPSAGGRARRVEFLKRAVDIGKILGAETVSFWAGVRQPSVSPEDAMAYLVDGVVRVTEYAVEQGMSISLEPEPGMLIETNADYQKLLAANPRLECDLSLALDLGHVWVTGEEPPARAVERFADRLGTVSIEGMNRGVHLHLPPDEGDMDLSPLLRALRDIDFRRLVCLELSRESPRAHRAIPDGLAFLKQLEAQLV
ncbi:sugar phosphate isomerase/epimerase family protein [Neolewinella litorea]|uniref:Sugar phosphate isomerase/epimerase n=1 Tax=Neolewinella litorea TaxID=2562452 RepID=A0A4S4NMZ2_9BACT|nr:sugar phosphate isomerase/epimerase family protein [Neolewinella litorea]THH41326.1 sugar phosphate isomerase/epimerase [Neolewinella litorea]